MICKVPFNKLRVGKYYELRVGNIYPSRVQIVKIVDDRIYFDEFDSSWVHHYCTKSDLREALSFYEDDGQLDLLEVSYD